MIDPKGFIGDPAFEVCAFIINPIPGLLNTPNFTGIIDYRIKQCAQILDLSEQRIRDWNYVKTVLCWAWSLEDNIDAEYFCQLINGA